MKKFKTLLRSMTAFVLALVMMLCIVACDGTLPVDPGTKPTGPVDPGDDPGTDKPVVPNVQIVIGDVPTTISFGETAKLTATVTGDEDTTYAWSVSEPTLVRIADDGTLSVLAAPSILDKSVTVTATANADKNAKASKTITVLAEKQAGSTGLLTSAMIERIGNASITVTGRIVDRFIDTAHSYNSGDTVYNMEVSMEDGKWKGAWSATELEDSNVISNVYLRGDKDGVRDENGRIGHELRTMYINKDNVVSTKAITNYLSIPAVWESQHYWNHLGSLPVKDFTYSATDPSRYIYEVDYEDETSVYLMLYLTYSLTPMLDNEDAFERIVLTVEDGEIVKFEAQGTAHYTNPSYDTQGNVNGYDAMRYTTTTLTFSNIGTTKVEDIKPYDAPDNVEKLQAALNKMHNAKSYEFSLTDTTTQSPSYDGSDYELDAAYSVPAVKAARAAGESGKKLISFKPQNSTSATGTVGLRGWVDEQAVLYARTGSYMYSMDGKNFWTEYSGMRQFDGYYENFDWGKVINGAGESVYALKGTKHVTGSMSDAMPRFEFSPNLFSCNFGVQGGKTVYIFTLLENSVIRDIAMQISSYSYATSSTANVGTPLRLVVDENGNLLSSTYPYGFTAYSGYCTTKYSEVDNIEIDMDTVFENYAPRIIKDTWDKYDEIKYYYDENGKKLRDENGMEINVSAIVGIQSIFGDNADGLPTPGHIMQLFDDNLSGPFYDDRTRTLENGESKYVRYMSFTASSPKYDENMQVTNYDEIVEIADRVFVTELGFDKDRRYTDITGGASGRSNRYLVYDNGKITVVIENNFTKNFWIYFYNSGDYSRTL